MPPALCTEIIFDFIQILDHNINLIILLVSYLFLMKKLNCNLKMVKQYFFLKKIICSKYEDSFNFFYYAALFI